MQYEMSFHFGGAFDWRRCNYWGWTTRHDMLGPQQGYRVRNIYTLDTLTNLRTCFILGFWKIYLPMGYFLHTYH